jgi:uncharacterized protein
VGIEKRGDVDLVPGQTHRIQTAGSLYWVVVGPVVDARLALAFSQASGDRLERIEGTDDALRHSRSAPATLRRLSPDLSSDGLNAVRAIHEVCTVFRHDREQGRGGGRQHTTRDRLLGVIDEAATVEVEDGVSAPERTSLFRRIGYRRW